MDLKEREFPEANRNYALVISEAVHDPAERKLTITWTEEARDLPAWRLTYNGTDLAQSAAPPAASIVVIPFVLQPSSAEVRIRAGTTSTDWCCKLSENLRLSSHE
jgi:hypothetical protein